MSNIDEMMLMWRQIDSRLTSLVEENKRLAEEVKKNKLQTSREKLARKYRAFIILEVVCIPFFILMIGFNPLIVDKFRWPTLIYWVTLFIFEIVIDSYLLERLNSIDIYNDSIVEISRKARTNWKVHKIAVLILLPIAIGGVVLFCMAMGGTVETIWGVLVGGAIGLGIGLNEFFKFLKNYTAMSREA